MEAQVNWNGKLSFTGKADSGINLNLSSDTNSDGTASGVRPIELFTIGLAGCTAMDVISILTKKRQEVTDFYVQVHADMASEHPKVFTRAVIDYYVTGHNLDEAAVFRAIELSAGKYCPAHAMLAKSMPIELHYHIYEDQGDSNRRHVIDGDCHVSLKANG